MPCSTCGYSTAYCQCRRGRASAVLTDLRSKGSEFLRMCGGGHSGHTQPAAAEPQPSPHQYTAQQQNPYAAAARPTGYDQPPPPLQQYGHSPAAAPAPHAQGAQRVSLGPVHHGVSESQQSSTCHICKGGGLVHYKCRACGWRSCSKHRHHVSSQWGSKDLCSRCYWRVVVLDSLQQKLSLDRIPEVMQPFGVSSGHRVRLTNGVGVNILGASGGKLFGIVDGDRGATEIHLHWLDRPPRVVDSQRFPIDSAERPPAVRALFAEVGADPAVQHCPVFIPVHQDPRPPTPPLADYGVKTPPFPPGSSGHPPPAPTPYAAAAVAQPAAPAQPASPAQPAAPASRPTSQPAQPTSQATTQVALGTADSHGYIREKSLGAGAQGTVYLCHRQSDGKKFAVKDIVVREHEAASKLSSLLSQQKMLQCGKHVVTYHDIWEEKTGGGSSRISIVMDYSSEGDLGRLIANARETLDEVTLLSFATQVASALEHMHGRRPPIIHMDVKPENILLFERKAVAKLTDFDASLEMTRQGQPPEQTTIEYTAPEVARGQISPASDVFSLGVVFFSLAALPDFPLLDGTLLNADRWEDHDALRAELKTVLGERVYMHNGEGSTKELRYYTPELISAITRMLSYNPQARPTLRELTKELHDLYYGLLTGEIKPEVKERFY